MIFGIGFLAMFFSFFLNKNNENILGYVVLKNNFQKHISKNLFFNNKKKDISSISKKHIFKKQYQKTKTKKQYQADPLCLIFKRLAFLSTSVESNIQIYIN